MALGRVSIHISMLNGISLLICLVLHSVVLSFGKMVMLSTFMQLIHVMAIIMQMQYSKVPTEVPVF